MRELAYGYQRSAGDANIVERSVKEQRVIRQILRMHKADLSPNKIKGVLEKFGILFRGRPWHRWTIVRIIRRHST
jgi:hypothetical protein